MIKIRELILVCVIFLNPIILLSNSLDNGEGRRDAIKYFKENKINEALEIFSDLHLDFPADPEINFYYGACLVRKHISIDKAIFLMHEAAPKGAPILVYYYLGMAYSLKYEFIKADKYYRLFKNKRGLFKYRKIDVNQAIEMNERAASLVQNCNAVDMLSYKSFENKDLLTYLDDVNIGSNRQLVQNSYFTKTDEENAFPFTQVQSAYRNIIYFSSYASSTRNGKDLFSVKKESIDLSEVEKLEDVINSKNDEINPIISADGKTLYFCSNGNGSMGGFDIFKSTFNDKTNEWSKAINLGFPINSVYDDFLFVPELTDSAFLLASNRDCSVDSTGLFILKALGEDVNSYMFAPKDIVSISLFEKSHESVTKADKKPPFVFNETVEINSLEQLNNEAAKDIYLLSSYSDYLRNEIRLCREISDSKIKEYAKKKLEAREYKVSITKLKEEDKSGKQSIAENFDKELKFLDSEADYLVDYADQLQLDKIRLEELKASIKNNSQKWISDKDFDNYSDELIQNRVLLNNYFGNNLSIQNNLNKLNEKLAVKQEDLIASKDLISEMKDEIQKTEMRIETQKNDSNINSNTSDFHKLGQFNVEKQIAELNAKNIHDEIKNISEEKQFLINLNKEFKLAGFNEFNFYDTYATEITDSIKNILGIEVYESTLSAKPETDKKVTKKRKSSAITYTPPSKTEDCYTIQIGIFSKQPDFDILPKGKPFYRIKTKSGLWIFTIGSFNKKKDASELLMQVKQAGLDDAFIKKCNLDAREQFYVNPEDEFVKEETLQNLKDKKGLFFTIQIGTFIKTIPTIDDFNIKPVFSYRTSKSLLIITAGIYKSLSDAKRDIGKVVKAGYADAFVISFYKGKIIKLKEAVRLSKSTENVIFASPLTIYEKDTCNKVNERSYINEIDYRIQIASHRNIPSDSLLASYKDIADKTELETYVDDNGMTCYTIGHFYSYSQALKSKLAFIQKGASDAFIVAFKGNKKIPVGKAINITEHE